MQRAWVTGLTLISLTIGCASQSRRYTFAHQFEEADKAGRDKMVTITRIETHGTMIRLENDFELILADLERKTLLEGDRRSRTFKPGNWKDEPMCEHMGDDAYASSECRVEFPKGGETKVDCKAPGIEWSATGKMQATDFGVYDALYQAGVLSDIPYCSLKGMPFEFSALRVVVSGKEGKTEQLLTRKKVDRTRADISRF